jgi:hypothetical protein
MICVRYYLMPAFRRLIGLRPDPNIPFASELTAMRRLRTVRYKR